MNRAAQTGFKDDKKYKGFLLLALALTFLALLFRINLYISLEATWLVLFLAFLMSVMAGIQFRLVRKERYIPELCFLVITLSLIGLLDNGYSSFKSHLAPGILFIGIGAMQVYKILRT